MRTKNTLILSSALTLVTAAALVFFLTHGGKPPPPGEESTVHPAPIPVSEPPPSFLQPADIFQERSSPKRASLLLGQIESMSEGELKELLDLMAPTFDDFSWEIKACLEVLSQKHRDTTLTYLLEHEDQRLKYQGTQIALRAFAMDSPVDARHWLDENMGQVPGSSLMGYTAGLIARDPKLAAEFVSNMAETELSNTIMQGAYAEITKLPNAEAIGFVLEIDDAVIRHFAMLEIVSSRALGNPNATAELIPSLLGKYRSESALALISKWMPRNPEAASTWLASLPRSIEYDRAIERLVRLTVKTDAERALLWAERIVDPDLRLELETLANRKLPLK